MHSARPSHPKEVLRVINVGDPPKLSIVSVGVHGPPKVPIDSGNGTKFPTRMNCSAYTQSSSTIHEISLSIVRATSWKQKPQESHLPQLKRLVPLGRVRGGGFLLERLGKFVVILRGVKSRILFTFCVLRTKRHYFQSSS